MTQSITFRRKRLEKQQHALDMRRDVLQRECKHKSAVKEPKSSEKDTGSTNFWYEIKCPNCGKFWIEDQ